MFWPFRLSRHCIWRRFLDLHDIELPLSAVGSLTLLTLQPQIWYDGALTGQMCNPHVLHLSEGQRDEKPGSVVSHFWPWLQVIKALLSFCQSSDSPNISPWLISAVSSVRVYTKPLKGSTPSLSVHYTLEHPPLWKADLDLLWYHPFWPIFCVSPQTYQLQLYQGSVRS